MRILLALCLVTLFILIPISNVVADSTGYIDVTITGEELVPSVDTLVPVVGVLQATLRGNVINDYGLDIVERGFNLGENPGVYTDNWSEAPGPWHEGIFTHLQNPLLLGHTYYYRAYAISSKGIGYGPEVIFTLSVQCPTNFTATAMSNTQVVLTWVMGTGSEKTYIRAKQGSYPTDNTDGYLVYFDNATTATDVVDLSGATGGIYYRAWGWASAAGMSACYGEDYVVGGEGMLILGFICLCGILTGLSGWKRFLPLAMAASIAWLTFAILALTSPSTIGVGSLSETWVQALGFVLALMVFVPVLLYIRPTTTLSKSKDGISWTEQGGIPKDKSSRSERAQREYRQQLRAKWRK